MDVKPTIDRLIEVARDELQSAEIALADKTRALTAAKGDREKLVGYKDGYLKDLNARAGRGINSSEYSNARHFIEMLGQAIALQAQVIEIQETATEQARHEWQTVRRKLLSYEVLANRRTKEVRLAQARLERKQNDGVATRLWLNKRLAA